ncbi:MAG TPA: hypothetical protein VN841_12330 [Bryobacteraceae bacterium]|nr:hypothetical protein [Bryobacteraceae bacterium]
MKTLPARFLLLTVLLGFAPAARSATIIYAATADGLLFRSTDAAKTWQPVPVAGAPVPAAQPALAVDPQNSSILYLSLKAGSKVPPGGNTGGIYRSADGGATWSQPTSPSAGPPRLAVDPTSSNIVYVGIDNSVNGGFFRSTDSAATWSAATLTDLITGIGTDPHQPGVVYASTDRGKIYKSADFGVTWTTLTSNPGFTGTGAIYNVAVDPNNSNALYAPVICACGRRGWVPRSGELWRVSEYRWRKNVARHQRPYRSLQ